MPLDEVCDICGEEDCPCEICHGDPGRYLRRSEGGIRVLDEDENPTGEIECAACGLVS